MKELPPPPNAPNRIPFPPKAPQERTATLVVNNDELDFILSTTLVPQHRDNIYVLKFIKAYLDCRNIRQASKEAGIEAVSGRMILNKKDVHECIVKITDLMVFKHGIDPSAVVERVKEFAELDPAALLREDGSYKKLQEIEPEVRRSIKKFKAKNLYAEDANGISVVVGELIEVEFWDKLKASELLGRETSLFKETKKVEHDVTSRMRDILLEAGKRAEGVIDVTPVVVAEVPVAIPEALRGKPVTEVKKPFPRPEGM